MTLTVDVEPTTFNYLLWRAEADSSPDAPDDLLFTPDEEPPLLQPREGKVGKMRIVSINWMPFPAPDENAKMDLS